jgi:nuclear RNA export factor
MRVASENIPNQGAGVVSISLAENGLRDVRGVETLATTFPDLKVPYFGSLANEKNLSLQQNNIARWSDLEPWQHSSKFPHLQELLLHDNPIQRNARDVQQYQREATSRFPSLKLLDGNPLVKMRFDVEILSKSEPVKVELPGKVRSGVWGEGSNEIGVGFLTVFFNLYDTFRDNLVEQYYTPTSLFSLSVDTVTPHSPTHHRRGAFSGSNQPASSNLGGYIPQSRNLQRTTTLQARTTRLHHGREQILQAFSNLPRTRHPVSEPSAFVADGFQVQIGSTPAIMVSVHGEFYESSDRGELRRSFDRTFLLGPPAPTNPGSQCVVVSDLLVLRPWSGRDSWVPEENSLIQEVRSRTGLNERYAELLLRENNGDLDAGLRRFAEAKVFQKFSAMLTIGA